MSQPPPTDTEDRSVLHREQVQPDRTIAYGSHPEHIAEVFEPTAPAVQWAVGIHGGFWRPAYDRVHLRNTAAALTARGVLSVLIEYRRVPGQPYQMVDDVCLALQVLPTLPDIADRVGSKPAVWGHSAGGHLALVAACRAPKTAGRTVALAPVTDLELAEHQNLGHGAVAEFLGGRACDHLDLDPLGLPAPHTPVTLIHGARDSLVPAEHSERLRQRWSSARCITLPDCGHFEVIDPRSAAWARVTDAITAT